MSWLIFFLLFFFVFRAIGNLVVKFLLNGNPNMRSTGHFSSDFQRIFEEMMNNLNQRTHHHGQQNSHNNSNGNSGENRNYNGKMSRKEALEVLGLAEGATQDDIKTAYRKLMIKMHPDSGGSKYLSQKINEAKELLVKD
jgi:hypothetical protein